MDESENTRPRRRATWLIVTMLVVVFVLYPLSVGPMFVLAYRTDKSHVWSSIYTPLFCTAKTVQCDRMIGSYALWWAYVTNTVEEPPP